MEHDIKETSVMGQINVTPMVDVMLVLLIIFMVVTPALLAGSAQLPVGVNLLERPEQQDRTTLTIDAEGNYALDNQPITRASAPALLRQAFDAHPQDRVLFLKADRRLRYSEVEAAMRMARTAGARVVAAVTEERPEAGDEAPEDPGRQAERPQP